MANLVACKQCGEELALTPRSTTKRFCSYECSNVWWNAARSQNLTNADRSEMLFGPVNATELTPVQAAWLAALVDGEGVVGVWRHRKPKNRSGYYYQAIVQITNTNFGLISKAKDLIPDSAVNIQHKKNKKHKSCYILNVYNRAIPTFLKQLLPYLVIKKKQAGHAIKFCELKESSPWRTDNHEIYEHFYLECKALNKKGRQ